MSERRTSIRTAISAVLLAGALYAGLSGYWLTANRVENSDERAYVTSPDDEDTRKEVIRRCGGPIPAPADECVREVEEAEERKQHERADLKAQQEVAEWTFATALIAFAALFLSAGGLAALVWTFREQRKLTVNQSRAYLELVTAHYTADRYGSIDEGEDTEDTISVTLTLHNSGETPALRVNASLVFHCTTEASGFGGAGGDTYAIEGISGEIKEIPGKGTYVLQAYGHGVLPHPKLNETNWRYRGPELKALGKITFEDVFGSPLREMEIDLTAPEIPSSSHQPPVEFWGPHRNRHGVDRQLSHIKARLEKFRADAARAKSGEDD